ncbi:glycosyltransferase family 4 protein [Scytonema tolypothrichoides VB-61278]|nr:glycosyltransferase family 4 protein [Scytonema tolypothrichoides VB-61278]
MNKTVLFFFPHNPYPAKSGAHKRCLETLYCLKELGFQVIFMSSTLTSETKWEKSSIEALKADFVTDVSIYEPTILDRKFILFLRIYYKLIRQTPPISSGIKTPFGMRRWFAEKFHSTQAKILFMNYANWDGLCSDRQFSSSRKVIDTHDLITLNIAMQKALKKYLTTPVCHNAQIDEQIFQEDFFEKLNLETSSEEFSVFDNYDHTIVISPTEIEIVKNKTFKTKISYIPVQQAPYDVNNQYEGAAIFPIGPNLFNIQGYLYFIKKILPLVLQQDSNFLLQVTGTGCKEVYPTEGVLLSGFVPNLAELYQKARFAVCPVFGGTGQQIKIVEAMAHGVPVVATRFAGERSPIIHNQNGFIANNAIEFAEYVLQLWKNKDLCQTMGTNAKETISVSFSRKRLIKDLSLILN